MGCRLLRQSTAITVDMGPALDRTDAYTEETGLTPSVFLSKAGAAQAARNSATAIAHDARGYYRVELNTTDTNTLGMLRALFHDSATHLPVWEYFMVIPALVYDALVAGSDNLEVDAILWRGTQPNTLTSGRVETLVGGMAANVITTASINDGAFTLAKFADGCLSAAKFAAGAFDAVWSVATRTLTAFSTGLAVSVWDVLASAVAAANSIGVQIATNLNATVGSRATQTSVDDVPTNAELAARTLAAADYATAAGVADVPTVAEFEARTLVAANYATAAGVADVPTVAEFEARTRPAAEYALDSTVAKEATLADVPTNAELAARTLAAAAYATAANQATMDGKLDTIDNFLDTEIQAIIDALAALNLDTDDIQTRLPAALVGGRMDSNMSAINNSNAAAIRQALAAGSIIPGTVDHAGAAATTTVFEADDITEATADHYNGRVIIFTSGAMLGQATSISDYALNGGRGRFTVPTMTEAPADNVTFIIV